MHVGKTLYAQPMYFLPWKTFHRIVDRYPNNVDINIVRKEGNAEIVVIA